MNSRRLADPQDQAARFAANARRARIEGPGVWLEALATTEKWDAQPEEAQDQAAEEVGRRLGSGWALRDVKWWECQNGDKPCPACKGRGRLAWINGQRVPIPALSRKQIGDGLFDTVACHCEMKAGASFGGGRTPVFIRHRLALFEHEPTGIEFSLVPGRMAIRNSWVDVADRGKTREEPAIRPLLVARWPVTGAQWHRSDTKRAGRYPELPITSLSHEDASAWCKQLGLRLPSAVEWTHAARGGAPTRFPWGDEVDLDYVWCAENSGTQRVDVTDVAQDGYDANPETIARAELALERLGIDTIYSDGSGRLIGRGGPRPHPPAEHDGKHNAFGLVDTVGNVAEWLEDGEAIGPGFHNSRHAIQADGARVLEVRGGLETIGFRPVASIPGLGAE